MLSWAPSCSPHGSSTIITLCSGPRLSCIEAPRWKMSLRSQWKTRQRNSSRPPSSTAARPMTSFFERRSRIWLRLRSPGAKRSMLRKGVVESACALGQRTRTSVTERDLGRRTTHRRARMWIACGRNCASSHIAFSDHRFPVITSPSDLLPSVGLQPTTLKLGSAPMNVPSTEI
jgi:hypothetical protein